MKPQADVLSWVEEGNGLENLKTENLKTKQKRESLQGTEDNFSLIIRNEQ